MNITTGEKIMTLVISLIFIVITASIIILLHSIDLLWNPASILIILPVLIFVFLPIIKMLIINKERSRN
jgi:hypothetical protein